MNAPLPADVLKALSSVTLDDKYTLEAGQAFMSGIQALVRLPMLQRVRDVRAGLNTAGFISGYRGSPLGAYDHALWQAQKHLAAHHIKFQPGVNEELGATAVWGSQQLHLTPGPHRYDGVFGLWYAKGPGVDRSADALKHANMAGTAARGGVIAVAGDDHAAKSSSLAHQSDHIFKACGIPVFFPSSVQEILDLGLHAYALSRFAGVWAGMKTIQEVVESSSTVCVDADRVRILLPEDVLMPEGGLNIRWPDTPLAQEARLLEHKCYAALAYIRANRLNQTVLDAPDARLGLMASGKAYNDLRQALHDLGLDDDACRALGLRIHKVAVVWPLEASITREFATGLQEILVVEEKRQMIEYQLKEELYNWREDVRPNVLGKFSEPDGDFTGGEWSMPNPARNTLLRAKADLTPALIAQAVAQRLERLGLLARLDADLRAHVAERLRIIEAKEHALARSGAEAERAPWFCSGCPHNTSTKVPEGSRALAGIGCHYMAQWMDRNTGMVCQMGGEGVTWVGQAPFTDEPHVFVNLGDGTYFHSGLLAIRQAIAAGVNITYKILYNDAVAMTGGQPLDGNLSVSAMTRELHAEGARRIVVVSDAPDKYAAMDDLAPGVEVFHRDRLDEVQQLLKAIAGCTVLIYEQTCATEKRRRRKRGKLPQATTRVVINELVCEGCGDCSVQSNCLSVETVETDLGRKRRINQSSCNQDLSCVKGFCPSLVTIEGGSLKAPAAGSAQSDTPSLESMGELPHPALPACDQAYGIVVAGIGGTGVITIGQLLGMAAHIEGKGVITQEAAGLAQKGGATWSHIQIAEQAEAIRTTKVGVAEAHLVLACDPIVAAHSNTLAVMHASRTHVALNTHQTPTAALVKDRDWQFPSGQCDQVLAEQVGTGRIRRLDAVRLAEQMLGDALYANPLMLGFAWQMGWVPLSLQAVQQAIELNGVQVVRNLQAFTWGRWAAHDPVRVARLSVPTQAVQWAGRAPKATQEPLAELVARRVDYLRQYQDEAYAEHYRQWVQRVQHAEQPLGSERLSREVATQLFRLMAIKDEYEVARLLTAPEFKAQLAQQFEGDWRMAYHLAPPRWWPWGQGSSPEGAARPVKQRHGAWMGPVLGLLARAKGLRGTWLDPFAWSVDRREDRAVLAEYEALLNRCLPHLRASNLAQICDMARVPENIRGYGPVRHAAIVQARQRWHHLWLKCFGGSLGTSIEGD